MGFSLSGGAADLVQESPWARGVCVSVAQPRLMQGRDQGSGGDADPIRARNSA